MPEISEIPITKVSQSEPKQETSVPEINIVTKYNEYSEKVASIVRQKFLPKGPNALRSLVFRTIPTDFFHGLRRVTAPSVKDNQERSLATRSKRAELFKELAQSRTRNRQEIISEAKARDEIAKGYLNQAEITVNFEGLGPQTARYNILEPPMSRKNTQSEKPPIFLIPGISNDLDSVAGLSQELAFSGRYVVTVAFPETAMGSVTQNFAEAVGAGKDYEVHTEFFKKALDKLIPNGQIEIWGFSTGGPIAAELLNNPVYQQRTTNAVLIAPVSSVDQSQRSLYLGLGHESFGFASTIQKYSFIAGRKEQKDTKEEHKAKADTFHALMGKIIRQKPHLFEKAKVINGGRILIISQDSDDVTKTEKAKGMFLKNPDIVFTTIKNAYHSTAVTEPERVIIRSHQFIN